MLKINDKYKPLWEESTRYYIATGGRGSAKSFSVGTYLTQKTFEKDNRVLFTRYTMTSAHSSIIPEFEEKIDVLNAHQYFKVNKTDITNIATNSDVLFKGIKTGSGNQTAALKSLQGVTVWVLDEAEELVDEETFDKIDMSIRKKGKKNIVILILNPTTKEHWIYKRFFQDNGVQAGWNGVKNDVTYIHTDYRDNAENLSESFISQVERIKETNPKKYNHIILGGWLDKAEGVIFENWTFGEFPSDVDYGFGLDFGFSVDPDALVKCHINKSKKEIYLKEELYKNGLGSDKLSGILKDACGNKQVIADNAEGRLIADLRAKGLNTIPCKKGAGSIVAGIKIMQDYKLIVDPKSTNLAKELNNYVWDDKKSEKPIDAYNHLLDACRYYITYNTRDNDLWVM
jgi:phage terminase large subunit